MDKKQYKDTVVYLKLLITVHSALLRVQKRLLSDCTGRRILQRIIQLTHIMVLKHMTQRA